MSVALTGLPPSGLVHVHHQTCGFDALRSVHIRRMNLRGHYLLCKRSAGCRLDEKSESGIRGPLHGYDIHVKRSSERDQSYDPNRRS